MDVTLTTLCRQIARPHPASQIHWKSHLLAVNMEADLTLKTYCLQIAGPHRAAQMQCFSCGNAHILALLMGVDLTVKTLCRQIAGTPLAAEIHCFSYGNPDILALLRGGSTPQNPLPPDCCTSSWWSKAHNFAISQSRVDQRDASEAQHGGVIRLPMREHR